MATHVYANGQEIACKATDGQAKTAFPDPCWSPPGPAAGPALIPYPNTAFAKDITNGTATVFIKGKEVAIEDKAYFATSTGNEAATTAFGQGQKTGVIKGKAYFNTWSFNVIFEGYGVDRHTDLVSHNHGSMPSNTPLFPYVSRSFMASNPCKAEQDRIERACKPESEHSEARKEINKKHTSVVGQLLKSKRKEPASSKDKHWRDDHCDGMHIALGSKNVGLEYAKELSETYKKLPNELNLLAALEAELMEMATKAGAKAFGKLAAKAGVKQLAGSSLPGWGNAAMAITSVVDGALAIGDVNEIRRVALESLDQLKVLKDKVNVLEKMSKEFADFEKLTPQQQLEKAQELGAEGQDILATLNPCARARKCNLVPKSVQDGSKVETADGKGCCPGQTGHHLIYDAMIKDAGCPDYKYSTAPTVCTEGTSQHLGSHKRVHDAMDLATQGLADKGKLQNNTMSLEEGIDNAVKAHMATFPLSRCKPGCIKAQLDGYYKSKCPNVRLKAVNKNGGTVTPDDGQERH